MGSQDQGAANAGRPAMPHFISTQYHDVALQFLAVQ